MGGIAPNADAAALADGLHSGFLRSARRHPDALALEVDGVAYTYAELRDRTAAIAATLDAHTPAGGAPLVAVFAYRTVTAFSGLLGTLLGGRGYVPLNRNLPPARTRLMLERSQAGAIIVDAESAQQLPEVLEGARPTLVLAPDESDVSALAAALPGHTVLGAGDLIAPDAWRAKPVDPDALAYLLFTSGSTGVPKGVMIAHRNTTGLMASMAERYAVTPADRVSQTHELTFDVSVFDMFVTWEGGACLCCPSLKELIKPGGFIRGSEITIWFAVPSTAIFMRKLGMLKPDRYPSLRHSLFAGEALPVEVARAWRLAAPNSTFENLYGPTEATIVCLGYVWGPRSEDEVEAGVVPIGAPLPGVTALIADPDLREVAPGETGELLVAGPQVALGYWRDPERTAASFVVPPGATDVHYRTGDRVRRPAQPDGAVTYLGRLDQQIKVRGVRIELGEVEAVIREVTGVDAVVAVGWPVTVTGADGIVAFIGDDTLDVPTVKGVLERLLPQHMVPRHFELLSELPLNASGKYDRKRLTESLDEDAP